ncbi:hopanoid biosynthesis associated radical SAM protein HpnH [Alteromonadaceae bacterium 2753L.S.0a.02]|nr:hopanoid biosynthesis associated radical SAM protein HpnH [Alteromonadaceae bacterium 2753L.S.0a.02]
MGVPLKQQIRIGSYLVRQKLMGRKRYPLVLMLEPLFQCNLECAGCGKIAYPDEILRRRVSVADALDAVDQADAPVVSIPGGEPLIHKEMPEIIEGIIARKKYIYLCTNAILVERHIHKYKPSPFLTFSIHLDGLQRRHDESVCREGVFETATKAIKLLKEKGFRVSVNCTLFNGEDANEVADFFDYAMNELKVEGITLSPGYSYELAPRQDVFLSRAKSKQLFRDIFSLGRKRGSKWRFNQSSNFLDFLAGNKSYQCSPWSNVTYNIFGWQKPCYLLSDEGYAASFSELMETTHWHEYGVGINSKCNNCMAHCGYEGTAVEDTLARPLAALKVAMRGVKLEGPMAPEPDIVVTSTQSQTTQNDSSKIPVTEL